LRNVGPDNLVASMYPGPFFEFDIVQQTEGATLRERQMSSDFCFLEGWLNNVRFNLPRLAPHGVVLGPSKS
jgi:hypothetical protein